MAASKKLKMVFETEAGKNYTLSVADPKDGLALADVKTAAASVIPAFEASGGDALSAFQSASVETTTVEELA